MKTFVIDTNVLLSSPNALFSFEENKVVLTEAVLEELDSFKKEQTDRGFNAREVIRILNELREKGKLTDGVPLNEHNGLLIIETNHKDINIPVSWENSKNDNRILQVCKALKDKGEEVHLITNDLILRVKADIVGIIAEGYETEIVAVDKQYTGRTSCYLRDSDFNKFYETGELELFNTPLLTYDEETGEAKQFEEEIYPNEFFILYNSNNQTALAKVDKNKRYLKKLQFADSHPYGISPKNVGQKFAIEALMDDSIPLVILKGDGGTGKTLLSIAAGLEKVAEEKKYRRIMCCRPTVQMEQENLGFLPGNMEDKIYYYMLPIRDSLEVLADSDENERYKNEDELNSKMEYLMRNYINCMAVGFLRGRSLARQWIHLDEAQNIRNQAMTILSIISRAGFSAKIVISGDPAQVDLPFNSEESNPLIWVAEAFKDSKLSAVVALEPTECVRSPLAEEANKILSEYNKNRNKNRNKNL